MAVNSFLLFAKVSLYVVFQVKPKTYSLYYQASILQQVHLHLQVFRMTKMKVIMARLNLQTSMI